MLNSDAKKTDVHFSKALKHLMEKDGVSLRNITAGTGIPHTTIHEYYHCTSGIPLDNAKEIATYFRTTVDAMLTLGETLEKKEAK